ncbi:hypothetical protein M758_8G136300 [Ceratodon purpureus]|nr:hypothetical protein M758_8G136300 [Ceratodon purpureus]
MGFQTNVTRDGDKVGKQTRPNLLGLMGLLVMSVPGASVDSDRVVKVMYCLLQKLGTQCRHPKRPAPDLQARIEFIGK